MILIDLITFYHILSHFPVYLFCILSTTLVLEVERDIELDILARQLSFTCFIVAIVDAFGPLHRSDVGERALTVGV